MHFTSLFSAAVLFFSGLTKAQPHQIEQDLSAALQPNSTPTPSNPPPTATFNKIITNRQYNNYQTDYIQTEYRITIHQEMNGSTSFIEWTLYELKTGKRLAGPSKQSFVDGPISKSMRIAVDKPTDKDTTNIKFQVRDGGFLTLWSTGSLQYGFADALWANQCFPMWKAKGAGFQRNVTCRFSR